MTPYLALLWLTLLGLSPTPSPALLVLEKAQNTLVILNPATMAIVGRVPVGNDPHEVAVSDDGRTAYITNYHTNGGAAGTTIAVVDLVAQKALAPIQLGALRAPHGITFAAGKVYFTAEEAKVVGRYDPASRTLDWVVGTGQDRTHMVVTTRDAKTVFTSNVSSSSVSIIEQRAVQGPDFGPPPGAPPGGPPGAPPGGPPGGGPRGGRAPRMDWHVANVAVGRGSEGFDLSPDERELWVANAQDATISVIDVATRRVVQTLPSTKSANRLKFTPDGAYVFVSDLGGDHMLVIDAKTRKEHTRIPMGGSSEGIVMAPDGSRAYATLNSRDAVAAIDLGSMTVTGEVKTGRGPDGLAWAVRR
jgi:YVTN family beta-propeller protein